jgi:uncharacterized membrane protein YccC
MRICPSAPPAIKMHRYLSVNKTPRLSFLHILEDSGRTALAAVVSLVIAGLCRLPESYWASITTIIIITQPAFGSAVDISIQRLIGTALGAGLAAAIASYFPVNLLTYALGVFASSLICHFLRLGMPARRFAGITLGIVMLIVRSHNYWTIATHRFIEVAMGIAVALAVMVVWPTRDPGAGVVVEKVGLGK